MSTRGVENEGVMHRARHVAEDLADLVGQHLKLARLELTADLGGALGRARTRAVLALLGAVGYALAMGGVAVLIGGNRRVGVALVAVGLVHVVGAGVALLVARARARPSELMGTTEVQARRSVATLAGRSSSSPLPLPLPSGASGASSGTETRRVPTGAPSPR